MRGNHPFRPIPGISSIPIGPFAISTSEVSQAKKILCLSDVSGLYGGFLKMCFSVHALSL